MKISYITLDRLASRKGTGRAEYLKDARGLSDETLTQRLAGLGITIDRVSFRELCDRHRSAEELSRQLVGAHSIANAESDWVWFCTTVLWERWLPGMPNLEMIDDKAQRGYELYEQQKIPRPARSGFRTGRTCLRS